MSSSPNEMGGSAKDRRSITVYPPPSTARIVAEPAPEEEQTLFGFVEEVSLSPKKRDRDATSSIPQPNSSHIATETAGEKRHSSAAAKQNRRINQN
jgi:hypothetical protein